MKKKKKVDVTTFVDKENMFLIQWLFRRTIWAGFSYNVSQQLGNWLNKLEKHESFEGMFSIWEWTMVWSWLRDNRDESLI